MRQRTEQSICTNCGKLFFATDYNARTCSFVCEESPRIVHNRLGSELTKSERDALARQFVPMVFGIARKWYPRLQRIASLEDVFQTAFCGLLKAIDGFVPNGEASFFTYAYKSAWGHMYSEINLRSRLVRIPAHFVTEAFKCNADPLDEKWNDAVRAAALALNIGGLPVGENGEQLDPASLDGPDYEAEPALAKALNELDDRKRIILLKRAEGEKITAVADLLGVSKQRIRQLQEKALVTVRRYLREDADGLHAIDPRSVAMKRKQERLDILQHKMEIVWDKYEETGSRSTWGTFLKMEKREYDLRVELGHIEAGSRARGRPRESLIKRSRVRPRKAIVTVIPIRPVLAEPALEPAIEPVEPGVTDVIIEWVNANPNVEFRVGEIKEIVKAKCPSTYEFSSPLNCLKKRGFLEVSCRIIDRKFVNFYRKAQPALMEA